MSMISWEDPPPSRSRSKGEKSSKWAAIAEALRARPGVWAHVDTRSSAMYAAQTAGCVRRGSYTAMPAGQFEAVSRAVDGECRVYARYVGGAQ